MLRMSRLVVTIVAAAGLSACATSLRNPHVADLRNNPGRYQDHSVNIDGVVTTSWGVPLVPFRLYKVDDGTGEVTVVSQSGHAPSRGAHVRVTGKVNDVATLGGQAIGMHIEQKDLHFHSR